jgi:hypothetical protein
VASWSSHGTLEFCFTSWTGDHTAAKRTWLVHCSSGNKNITGGGIWTQQKKRWRTLRSDSPKCNRAVVRQWATSLTLEEMAAKKIRNKENDTLHCIVVRYDMFYLTWGVSNCIFMYPGKKRSADPIWSCPELCPSEVIASLDVKPAFMNQDELLRAEWFWNRRPRVLCANAFLLFSYILVFVCVLYVAPECVAPLLAWIVVGASGVAVDCVRLERWRREYALSIKRLILHPIKRI